MSNLRPRLPHYAETGPLYFYGGPFSSFANRDIWLPPAYAGAPADGEPELYGNREEYFASAKATSREDHDWILEARRTSTWKVKERGREVELREGWDDHIAYPTMLRSIAYEVETYPHHLGAMLTASGKRQIAEDSPTDYIWGIRDEGGGLTGQNLLGLAWMHAREWLRSGKQGIPTYPVRLYERGWVRDKYVMAKLVRAESVFYGRA